MEFSVSVVIPVFNAQSFIEKSINSALKQKEVLEVVVVNDGSTDETQEIVENIEIKEPRVKVFYHPNYKNKGRSASRNLGVEKAKGNYIAFLDADDFYLDNRFRNDVRVFKKNKDIDGVYNAIGAHFYRAVKAKDKGLELTTVNKCIPYNELFEYLLSGKEGYFSIDGLTVKKLFFEQVGCFVNHLTVAEDTDLILKMSLVGRLEAGIIDKPLAMRGVHCNNVFDNDNLYHENRSLMFLSVINWALRNKITFQNVDLLLKWFYYYKSAEKNSLIKMTGNWFYLMKRNPKLITSILAIKYFPIVRERKRILSFFYK